MYFLFFFCVWFDFLGLDFGCIFLIFLGGGGSVIGYRFLSMVEIFGRMCLGVFEGVS